MVCCCFFFKEKIIYNNEYLAWIILYEKDSHQWSPSEGQSDGGGPKEGGNQGDDPFKVLPSRKIVPVHSALLFLPEFSR